MIKVTFNENGSVHVETSLSTAAFSIMRDGREISVLVAEPPATPVVEPTRTVRIYSVPGTIGETGVMTGPAKIAIIKAMREHAAIGLHEAKALFERTHPSMLECTSHEAACAFVREACRLGAAVVLSTTRL